MTNLQSFLKQCIAEVIVEPRPQPARQMKGMKSFLRQCIAEVICEPAPRKVKVVGNPKRYQMAQLIKECTLEVLRENLTEAFDPQSQGPNIVQDNPYPAMNAKMRTMENDTPEPKEDAWVRYEKGYEAGEVRKRAGIKADNLDNVAQIGYRDAITGKPKAEPDVVRKTVKETDPHGRYAQDAGAGQFDSRTFGQLQDAREPVSPIAKTKRVIYTLLQRNEFQRLGSAPRDYVEYYLSGFVTIYCAVNLEDNTVQIQRYYDSERLDTMPGYHIEQSIPIPAQYDPTFVKQIVAKCIKLKRAAKGDESILGGMDDIEETKSQHSNIEWQCPHCGQMTDIDVEVESPSDYIASSDCEHCGKEISDPKLDAAVYNAVVNHYQGKGDALKDTH